MREIKDDVSKEVQLASVYKPGQWNESKRRQLEKRAREQPAINRYKRWNHDTKSRQYAP